MRRGPGETRCPRCRHIVLNSELCEIIRADHKKGKVVCLACGVEYLRLTDPDMRSKPGQPEIEGQQSINMTGDADNDR